MLAGGMNMKRDRRKTAAQVRAAVFLLILGCLIPSMVPHGQMEISSSVDRLLIETLADEQDAERIAFVRTACALVGQIDYFWGGKSRTLGWDRTWGWPRRVSAPGSDSTGHFRSYGLDCSGLVSWAAATAWVDPAVYDRIGEGVRQQYALSASTAYPRPGDLAFFRDLSHVGTVLGGANAGVLWIVYCSASRTGAVMTPASVGFELYGSPSPLSTKG